MLSAAFTSTAPIAATRPAPRRVISLRGRKLQVSKPVIPNLSWNRLEREDAAVNSCKGISAPVPFQETVPSVSRIRVPTGFFVIGPHPLPSPCDEMEVGNLEVDSLRCSVRAAAPGPGAARTGEQQTSFGAAARIVRTRGRALIRQAITCDICGSEKRQTNHWFVAHEQGEELRLAGWNSRNRLKPGTKHLCGQTCLHKLVDEFMAKVVAVRLQPGAVEESVPVDDLQEADASLTSESAFEPRAGLGRGSAVRGSGDAESLQPKLLTRPSSELVAMMGRPVGDLPALPETAPRLASRNWRAEAWDRERQRELRAVDRRSDLSARRRSGS